ncbi:hypothetical protein VHEMI06740 [[Torrubiella] hemipterigena]|uniref:Uncharacterized protein n=1 Tax=[Torrubiella] hemipterigena TaxID=1531966 RepID=A0A0A1TK49_9HYPO|nr:hypothetical protein VHEMI06740 [[Torrubiella] hemipterigena]
MNHANSRSYRSLRTIQGLDYITALRGMGHIALWDFGKWLDYNQKEVEVRDRDFWDYMNRVARKAKPTEQVEAETLSAIMGSISKYTPRGTIGTRKPEINIASGDQQQSDLDPKTKFLLVDNEWAVAEAYYNAFYPVDKSSLKLVHNITLNSPSLEQDDLPNPSAEVVSHDTGPRGGRDLGSVQQSRNRRLPVDHGNRRSGVSHTNTGRLSSNIPFIRATSLPQQVNVENTGASSRASSEAASDSLFVREPRNRYHDHGSRVRDVMREGRNAYFGESFSWNSTVSRSVTPPSEAGATTNNDDKHNPDLFVDPQTDTKDSPSSQLIASDFNGYDIALDFDVDTLSTIDETGEGEPLRNSIAADTDGDDEMQDQEDNDTDIDSVEESDIGCDAEDEDEDDESSDEEGGEGDEDEEDESSNMEGVDGDQDNSDTAMDEDYESMSELIPIARVKSEEPALEGMDFASWPDMSSHMVLD